MTIWVFRTVGEGASQALECSQLIASKSLAEREGFGAA
jgi:hypothetical protein